MRTNKDRTNLAVPVLTLICTKSGEIDSQSLAFGVTTSASGWLFLRMEVVKPKNRGHLSIFFFCLAVKLMVTHYCTKPIWAQLVPLMLSVELLPIKMIVWVSNAPFRSCPQSLPLTLFVHVCPFSCPRRWDLYIQGRFSSNPPYLILSNLLGCAHGRGKSFRDIWYSPTLSRQWNKLIFTFFGVPVCPWPGANCFFTYFYDYVTPNWENDGNDCQKKKHICCPYLDATQATCNCSSRNFIIFNMLEMIYFF